MLLAVPFEPCWARKTYLADKALYATVLGHDVLTYAGIVGKLAPAEVYELTHHINSSAQKAKHDERIV